MNLPLVFNKYRTEIDAELKATLAARQSGLYDMMRYHLGWQDEKGKELAGSGGKALRPTLCLLACEAVGGDYRRALPAAAAIELVHNFSLIHDDIQDDDRERRHRPTVWSIWGKPQAINAGTAMRILANVALRRLKDVGVPDAKQMRAHRLIDEQCLSLIEGQYLDISYETREDVTIAEYLDMISKKTAALIAGALELGAILGTDDERTIQSLRDIGTNLGMAFQVRDDVLGIWGDAQKTGKSTGSDIIRKKKTFPVIWAFDMAKGRERTNLLAFYRDGTTGGGGVAGVLSVLEGVDAQGRAQEMVENYRDKALALIKGLPITTSARDELEEMLDFLTERDF